MFELTRYGIYCGLMEAHLDFLDIAEGMQDAKLITLYSRRAIRVGNKILKLEEKVLANIGGSIKPILDALIEQYTCVDN